MKKEIRNSIRILERLWKEIRVGEIYKINY